MTDDFKYMNECTSREQADGEQMAPIQLSYPLTPWAQLVAPICIVRTRASIAKPIVEKFLRRWPTPEAFQWARAERESLFILHVHGMLIPLGLSGVRTSAILNVATVLTWHMGGYTPIPDRAAILVIPGCGAYVADSFDIFYRGSLDVYPDNPVLAAYVSERRRRFRRATAGTRCAACEDGDA